MIDLISEWKSRGFVHQITDEKGLAEHLGCGRRSIYCGYDPTADSLQVGNLVPMMLKAHAQRAGHKPVVIAGGATGMIGDPSGKSAERPLLSTEAVQANVEAQRPIFEAILDFSTNSQNAAEWINNADWLGRLSMIEFLRDYGKNFSVNEMLRRDNVRTRLEQREQGISFTEFSYGILQAIDFLYLYEKKGITIQAGGSDQFGNIVSGIDLVRRVTGGAVFGVTAPLITRTDGQKFGKTETGSVWLSAGRTSPFAYYQFWLNAADPDVERYLKLFTFLSLEEISQVVAQHERDRAGRFAQKHLAFEATALLHGRDAADRAADVSAAIFGGEITGLSARDLESVFGTISSSQHARSALEPRGVPMAELLVRSGVSASKREAREHLQAGAIRLNGQHVNEGDALTVDRLLGGAFAMISRGKKVRHLTRWT